VRYTAGFTFSVASGLEIIIQGQAPPNLDIDLEIGSLQEKKGRVFYWKFQSADRRVRAPKAAQGTRSAASSFAPSCSRSSDGKPPPRPFGPFSPVVVHMTLVSS